jgi:hypothetical protein
MKFFFTIIVAIDFIDFIESYTIPCVTTSLHLVLQTVDELLLLDTVGIIHT